MSYALTDMCAACGQRFGKHFGLQCSLTTGGRFVLAVEEAKEVLSLGKLLRESRLLREVLERGKPAAQPDPNAAMIARDEQAAKRARIKTLFHQIGENYRASRIEQPRSTAKPALSALTLSPDLSEAKHQVNAQHAMAAVRSAGN